MKKLVKKTVVLIFVLSSMSSFSQSFQPVDEVPHDITYYRESRVTAPLVKVIYGRPSVQEGVEVFGNSIPFNEIWRTGANEATELKIYQDVVIGTTKLKAGTYVLYTVPGEKEWEIILSSQSDVLGAFQYDPIFDVAKIKVSVKKAEPLKTFSIAFKKADENTVQMVLAWGSTRVKVPMAFSQDEYLAKTVKKQQLPTP